MALMSWSALTKNRVHALFFHHDPGRAIPQWGQRDSSALISFLQLGQRIDCLWWLVMAYRVQGRIRFLPDWLISRAFYCLHWT